ncbi:MAG: ABC transporter ATP-binding protein [Bacteroidales bacterium]|nr:ABC transporter ATP-binding protein [Bacteroidales bacterium]
MKATLSFTNSITKGFRLRIALIVLLGLLGVFFSLAFVWCSKLVIDIATKAREGELTYYALLLILLMAFSILFRVIDVRLRRMTEVKLGNAIRYNLFSQLLYTRWQELSLLHSGDMLTRFIKDSDEMVNVLVTAVPLCIVAAAQFAGALVVLYILDPMLAIILGVALPIIALLGKTYSRLMHKYTREVKEGESQITSMVEENLQNQPVIRTFERQESELGRLQDLQSRLHGSVGKRTGVSVIANLIMGIAFSGGYLTAFLWGAYGLAKGIVTFGIMTAYLQLVGRLQRPLYDLMRLLPSLVTAKASIERLIYLTGFAKEESGDSIYLQGNVLLLVDQLTFSYKGSAKPVLRDFSMTAKRGTMVALTGKTGAGKTTFLRLLLGLVKPDSGTIRIADEKYSLDVSEKTRANFVYVPQGGSLFSGTIRENLLLGDPNADDDILSQVLTIAAADFVFTLPEGLDTVLGQDGGGLSEGQAQRIAIARALLRKGKVLLFDEATSALDTETEKRFLNNLKASLHDRIAIFITHSEEVACFCDYRYHLGSEF